MPLITTKTNTEISCEKEKILKSKLGEAITSLGKTESWLMLEFEDNCRLWFKGENDKKLAMVDISLFGRASSSAYDKMTAEVTNIISKELDIAPENIYVKYDEVGTWGWNGNNF